MQFVFQPLAWGFLLVLVPLLVHLINLLRHRRQQWAAMEFLMESYRKHRRWVWMKQLLLLISRMAAMAVLVAMLAQWVSGARWLSIFGQTITHHYVLVDDSMSMGDSVQGESAYQNGLRAVTNLLRSVADDTGSHQVTIIRYSRASLLGTSTEKVSEVDKGDAQAPPASSSASSSADILARTIPSNSDSLLDRLMTTMPVAMDVSPVPSLQTIAPLIRDATNEQSVVYLVSDFREKDWKQSQAIRTALEPIQRSGSQIQFIDCAPQQHANLSIVALQTDQEILATGVPVMVRVDVRNQGIAAVRNINLTMKLYEFDPTTVQPRSDRYASGNETQLPPVIFDSIAPGETVSRRVQVIFSKPGSHVVQAILPDDPLLEDNSFPAVLDVTEGQQLLLIDGDDSRRGSFYLSATLNPGSMARTGWKIRSESPSFLRDTDAGTLKAFAAIVMMNTRGLEARGIANLESFVRGGGGLAIWLGGNNLNDADLQRFNRDWYRDGNGLLPSKAIGIQELIRPADSAASPDMIAESHPIFAPLLGLSNSPFQFVRISKFVAMDRKLGKPSSSQLNADNTESASDPTKRSEATAAMGWQSIAKLRDGSPLIIDHSFGDGHVVTITTALDSQWTNWPQDPTFVVAMLKMVGYLASFRSVESSDIVGTPIQWQFSSREFLPEVDVLLGTSQKGATRLPLTANATVVKDPTLQLRVDSDLASQSEEQIRSMLSSGVTELWATTLQGNKQVKNVARHGPSVEGELKKIPAADLISNMRPIDVKYRLATAVAGNSALSGLTNRQGLLLALLLGLLMLEQFLAWSASYHIPRVARGVFE